MTRERLSQCDARMYRRRQRNDGLYTILCYFCTCLVPVEIFIYIWKRTSTSSIDTVFIRLTFCKINWLYRRHVLGTILYDRSVFGGLRLKRSILISGMCDHCKTALRNIFWPGKNLRRPEPYNVHSII